MDDTESENMTETDATMTEVSKPEKPRGKCTGCDFDYQLGTARTGDHKGKLVIRKHNSRTGPGLCSGAQKPPEGADVVGVAPGGTPIVTDPWTAPVPAMDVENGQGEPDGKLGPWVTATFDGDCDGTSCGGRIVEGEEIRADGEGGWLCEPCGEDAEIVKTDHGPAPYSISDAVAAAPLHESGPWTPTGTVLDRMPPEQRAEALSTSNTVIGIHAGTAPTIHPATVPVLDTGTMQVGQQPRYTDPNASRYEQDDNPGTVVSVSFTAPAPASDIPESTTTVSGQPEPDRDRWGRYLIMGTAHTRATTFAKLGANTKAIEAWNERNVIRGLTLRPDLLMLANGLEVKRDREQLNSIASQAKDAAGSKVAANIGTAYHAFSERIDAGLMTLEDVPPQYRARVQQYITKVANAGLTTRPEWIERTTAVRADQISAPLPVAGTLDRIFQLPDGSLVIGDLKTGSDLSYGEMEIEVQLALYAHGVNTHGLFDWNTKTWQSVGCAVRSGEMLQTFVRTDIAIVVHLPADGDGCTLYVADIERGWRDAQRLGGLQASLKDKPKGKRFRTLMASDLAPRPAPSVASAVQQAEAWNGVPQTREEVASPWELAKSMFSNASSREHVAELYQFAMDSGRFHQDQLAVLVGLGKDRLNALARQA